jgi:hypothetical protein
VAAQGESAPAAQSLYRIAKAVITRLDAVRPTSGGPNIQID